MMYSLSQAANHGPQVSAWAGAPSPQNAGRLKAYRLHNCSQSHRTGSAMARCVWGSNARVEGQGAFAVVHWLKVGRSRRFAGVLLFNDETEARAKFEEMTSRRGYCGGSCRNAGGRHELVRLDLENQETK